MAVRMLRDSGPVSYALGETYAAVQFGTTETYSRGFSANGDPTPEQTTRTIVRKLPDGTIETIETTLNDDIRGRQIVLQRTTTREKSTESSTRSLQTVERPSVNGGLQTAARTELVRVEDCRGGATVDTTRYTERGASQGLSEFVCGRSVMQMTDRGPITETTIYERSLVTGRTQLAGRKICQLTQNENDSATETGQVFVRLGNPNESAPIDLQQV